MNKTQEKVIPQINSIKYTGERVLTEKRKNQTNYLNTLGKQIIKLGDEVVFWKGSKNILSFLKFEDDKVSIIRYTGVCSKDVLRVF